MQQVRLASMSVASLVLATGPALACGHHNPREIARGIMNLVCPNSLYVRTAAWQAQEKAG